MNDEWFALDEFNQVRGPYSRAEIVQLAETKNCQVCREGMTTWALPSSLPELRLPPATGRIYHLHPSGEPGPRPRASLGGDRARILGKSMDEFLGILKGIVADKRLNDQEIGFLEDWLSRNKEVSGAWPADQIARRIGEILRDRTVTPEERSGLLQLLESTVGGPPPTGKALGMATRLPLDDPPPKVEFRGKLFCFTGTFVYGTRDKCEEVVVARGGCCIDQVTAAVDVLVIGVKATRAWAHTSFGRKIEDAVAMKRAGRPVRIIGEEHWVAAIKTGSEIGSVAGAGRSPALPDSAGR